MSGNKVTLYERFNAAFILNNNFFKQLNINANDSYAFAQALADFINPRKNTSKHFDDTSCPLHIEYSNRQKCSPYELKVSWGESDELASDAIKATCWKQFFDRLLAQHTSLKDRFFAALLLYICQIYNIKVLETSHNTQIRIDTNTFEAADKTVREICDELVYSSSAAASNRKTISDEDIFREDLETYLKNRDWHISLEGVKNTSIQTHKDQETILLIRNRFDDSAACDRSEDENPIHHLKIAKKILSEARKYPLFEQLLTYEKVRGRQKSIDNILSLLRQITEIHISPDRFSVKIVPLLSASYNWIETSLDSFLQKEYRIYTKVEVISLLGNLALLMKRNNNASVIRKEEIPDNISPYQSQILDDAGSEELRFLIYDQETHTYTFTYKHLRLIFEGIEAACAVNDGTDPNQEYFKRAIETEEYSPEMDNPYPTLWSFNEFVFSMAAYLDYLAEPSRNAAIQELCDIVSDLSPKKQYQNKKIVHLLSLYLAEGKDLSADLRLEIFRQTYGRTFHKIQASMWTYLRQKNRFYSDYPMWQIEKACRLEKDGFADEQPFFIQLCWSYRTSKGNINAQEEPLPKDFLVSACHYQHHSWFGGDINKYKVDIVFQMIDKLYEKLVPSNENKLLSPDENIPYYVYSSQMLLYSLANIRLRSELKHESQHASRFTSYYNIILKKIRENDTATRMIRLIVYTDFWTRKTNRLYNSKERAERFSEMFLLSGTFHACSSYEFKLENGKITLRPDVKECYAEWLVSERPRYQCLLERMLTYTDFFDNAGENFKVEKDVFDAAIFLPHDRMPEYKAFSNAPWQLLKTQN